MQDKGTARLAPFLLPACLRPAQTLVSFTFVSLNTALPPTGSVSVPVTV